MPNQSDPTQNPNPAGQASPPVLFPQQDLPPLSPDFQNVTEASPANPPPVSEDAGSSAPPDASAPIPKAKKKFGGGKLIATILGLVVLVGGVGAGILLTQQRQLLQQKAAVIQSTPPPFQSCSGGSSCLPDNEDQFCDDQGQMCTYYLGECGFGFWSRCVWQDVAQQHKDIQVQPGQECTHYVEGAVVYHLNCDGDNPFHSGYYLMQGGVDGTWACIDYSPQCEYREHDSCVDDPSCGGATPPGTPVPTPTPTPPPGTPLPTPTPTGPLSCDSPCNPPVPGQPDPCPAPLKCWVVEYPAAFCRNPSCYNNTNCICATTIPTPVPTPPPPGAPSCISVKAYNSSWTLLTSAQLPTLIAGTSVNFCVNGYDPTSGDFDRAQFKINSTLMPETTTKRPNSSDFCQAYTILASDTTVNVRARIHHSVAGWVGEDIGGGGIN